MKKATLLSLVIAAFIVSTAFTLTPQDDKLKMSMATGQGLYAVFVWLVICKMAKESMVFFLHWPNQIS